MKKYVIEAVWNDTDFGKIATVASFRTRIMAQKRLEKLESSLVEGQAWHYELKRI